MKKIVHRYHFSKYRRFTNGLVFGIISIIALLLCLSGISDYPVPRTDILLPFTIAIISLVLGFITMFHQSGGSTKDKAFGQNVR